MIRLMVYPSFNQGAVVRPDRACSFGLTLTLPRCEGVHPDEGNNYEHESQCNELFHPGYFPFAFSRRVEDMFKSRALCMTEAVERSSDFAIESALTFSSAKSFRRRISSSVHVRPFTRLISSPSAPALQAGGWLRSDQESDRCRQSIYQ